MTIRGLFISRRSGAAAFRRVYHNPIKGTLHCEWVPSHQDNYKLWHQPPIEQQLNCMCDTLAKKAVADSLHQPPRAAGDQLLPQEKVAVIIDGVKQTSDVAKAARYYLGYQEAERLYTAPIQPRDAQGRRPKTSGLGWSKEAFRAVDWETLSECLRFKPQMYQLWLSKQSSGFCGTQDMVARWDATSYGLVYVRARLGRSVETYVKLICTSRIGENNFPRYP